MKSIYITLSFILLAGLANAQGYLTYEELGTQKKEAIANEQYRLAKIIQEEIDKRDQSIGAISMSEKPEKDQKVLDLEKQQREAVAKEDWVAAKSVKRQINAALGIVEVPTSTISMAPPTNLREKAYQEMKTIDYATANSYIPAPSAPTIAETNTGAGATKLKDSEENDKSKNLKYRRSSLYTLMVNDPVRQHAATIKDAFGNSRMPEKFNDHNIGPYMIDGQANSDNQAGVITTYLNTNNVARDLVAKWFNRSGDGKFNMGLIAARGMYDASAMDQVVANSSERGNAMLADAGEELIGNTFIIVNDFKFTNKEEAVAKGKKVAGFAKLAAGYIPGGSAIQKGISAAETAATVAGKGYWVRTTSYLYRLVWDEEAAAIFYNNYWTDENNFDPAKVEAFSKAADFKLKLIGSQTAGADVQSSIFTDKSETDLIRMATVKATDRAIAKLEKKYEEFRTKTPLYGIEPLSAKIGTKEGLEKGDKFEVLEQYETEEGKTAYKRVGIIKADKIWDNSFSAEEFAKLKEEGKLVGDQFSTFKGSGKYYPGMLIKQIN